jgi:hypothetical protein
MSVRVIDVESGKIAIVNSDTVVIFDGQSALEFVSNIFYEHDCLRIAVNKDAISEDFFRLSTGVAGEIAQKFANYRYHVAIIGDFSGYTSKPLQDYIYECNEGRVLCFVTSEDEALTRLSV